MAKLLPMVAAAMTGIFVGATIVATRFVIDQTNPASLALWRYLIGSCCLLPPLLLSARARFERRDLLPSALCGAICSVLYRPYLRKYPTLSVSALAMFASVVFLAAFAAGEGFYNSLPRFTVGGWLAVGFIGISSGIGYYLWLWALSHTTPTKVTVFLALSPVTATILGGVFLAERVSKTFLWGLLCVALGLWLSHRQPHHDSAAI